MKRARILVVEDESLVAQDLGRTLGKMGFEVPAAADSGEEAIRLAEEIRPDLVMMDIKLKGRMEGIEAAGVIRSTMGVPVIFLTAHSDTTTVERAKNAGAYGFILKPFKDRELEITIEMSLQRLELEKELNESRRIIEKRQEQYRQLVEYANDIIIQTDSEGRILYVNPAAERITGYRSEELIGRRYDEFIHPEQRKPQIKLYSQQVAAGNPIAYYELPLIGKNGSEIWVGQTLTLILKNGKITGLHSIARDITAQRRLERAIRKRERNFRTLIENSMDLISIVASDGIILYQSPSSERVLGYHPSDLIGETISAYIHPDDTDAFRAVYDVSDDNAGTPYRPVEYRLRHADGGWRTLESLGKTIRDEEGVTAVILNSRDVTDKKLAEETVHRRNKELQQINRDLENLYDISRATGKSIELDVLLKEVLESMMSIQRLRFEPMGAILLMENGRLNVACSLGLSDNYTSRHADLIPGNSSWAEAFRESRIIQSCPLDTGNGASHGKNETAGFTNLIIPLTAVHKTVGVLSLFSSSSDLLEERDYRMLSAVGNQIGIAISNAQQYEETRSQSLKDPLTGIANRRAMEAELKKRIDEYLRYEKIFSIIMADIDHFKRYNDTHGHLEGDRILVKVSEILAGEIRKTDQVYRYGGEEFLMLLIETPLSTAEHVAGRLRAAVEQETSVTISLGVAVTDARTRSAELLIAAADGALYRAKSGGRNRVEVQD